MRKSVSKEISALDDVELWVLLHQARHAMFRVRQRDLDKYNISFAQAAILVSIQVAGHPMIPAEIARWQMRTENSVSGVLNRMERDGLVQRVRDLDKKNLVRIAITEKGKEIFEKTSSPELIHKLLSDLTKTERKYLRSSLLKMRDAALAEFGMSRPPSPKTLTE